MFALINKKQKFTVDNLPEMHVDGLFMDNKPQTKASGCLELALLGTKRVGGIWVALSWQDRHRNRTLCITRSTLRGGERAKKIGR